MKIKKIFFVLLTLLLCGLNSAGSNNCAGTPAEDGNLLQNGGFETINPNGLPNRWIKHTYGRDRGAVVFSVEKNTPYEGVYAAVLENTKPEDSKWVQFVTVKPAAVYKLSCKIKTTGIGSAGKGACISVLGAGAFSLDFKDTAGKWEEVVLYGKTGPDQTSFGAAARLGGPGALNTGRAYFDDFRVEEIESPPGGVTIARLYKKPEPLPPGPKEKSRRTGTIILSVILLYVLFWAVYFFIFKRRRAVSAPSEESPPTKGRRPVFTRADYILCGALTLVYAIIAFINLGSLKAPQTFWEPKERQENFYIDLGEVKEIGRTGYYFGLGTGVYKLEFSDDMQVWGGRQMLRQNTLYEKIKWRFLDLKKEARYVKITCMRPGVMLGEIVFFAAGSKEADTEPLPIVSVQRSAGSGALSRGEPENVFDEQDTVFSRPGFFSGMYFDEVYHARTAYEHLLLREPTETTHPPLGKVIISLGIALFGMTPFGWRFMGVLLGILMVPIMYKFGLMVFAGSGRTANHASDRVDRKAGFFGKIFGSINKTSRYAFITAFLMAFDFMHFTQTRIATIDVYGLFFIILMYYFMYKYFTMDFAASGLKKTLLPLALSGIFFGFGVAAKWITLYGGAGLAVIFFTALFQYYREHKKSGQAMPVFRRFALITLLWCVLFFIVVPAIIYTLSYVPFMMVPGPGHELGDVATYQAHMYNYHSAVKDDHPFSSTWWQWPLMKTPTWYYNGENLPQEKTSSIVAMGNPAIWWVGIVAVLGTVILAMKKRHGYMFVILTGFAAQYLTWAIVPRDCTFIYHFFGAVPFLILCITYMIKYSEEKFPKARFFVNGYLTVVLVLFIMFYPVLSGMVVGKTYVATFLRWLKSWVFFT